MDGEETAAVIGGASGLIGALIGGSAAVWAARHQGRLAVKSALDTARSTYLGPLDTARRTAQRDVFARFLTVSQEWARPAGRAAAAAEHWDQSVAAHVDRLRDENLMYVDQADAVANRYRRQVSIAGEPLGITEAAQHVLLEAAGTDVVEAAQTVERHAVRLQGFLNDAGTTELMSDDYSRADPSNHRTPYPGRSPAEHRALEDAIEAFARKAAAHLNQRDLAT
ncbi:hypothetical protein [Streptomyces sp. NPDC055140]